MCVCCVCMCSFTIASYPIILTSFSEHKFLKSGYMNISVTLAGPVWETSSMRNLFVYVCVSCSEALQVATFIRKNAKKQTTRFAGNLEIGPKLKIPIKIFTKVGECSSQLHVVPCRRAGPGPQLYCYCYSCSSPRDIFEHISDNIS